MNYIAPSAPDQDQEPPSNIEAEQQLLGALLTNNANFDKITDLLNKDHFYDPVHQRIYEIIERRVDSGLIASPVTLKSHMTHDQGLQELGGLGYLANLAAASVSAFAVRDYASLIVEEHAKRQILASAESACFDIRQGDAPSNEIANRLEDEVARISATVTTKPLTHSFLSSMTGALEQINDAYQGTQKFGVDSGIASLDRLIGGLRPGSSIVLAGRPSMGKTTIAHNIALNVARSGNGVFFASLEMTSEELAMRAFSNLLAARGQALPYNKIIRGDLKEDQFRAIVDVAQEHEALPLIIGERECRNVSRFRSAARRAQQQLSGTPNELRLVVVDYVQKLEIPNSRNTYEEVSRVSDAIKNLAMDLNVAVIGLSQLSRGVENRDPPVPMLSDLRESGKLEEDADAVILAYRPAYYLAKKLDTDDGEDVGKTADLRAALEKCELDVDLIVAKQRQGATGTAHSKFHAALNFMGTFPADNNQKDFGV